MSFITLPRRLDPEAFAQAARIMATNAHRSKPMYMMTIGNLVITWGGDPLEVDDSPSWTREGCGGKNCAGCTIGRCSGFMEDGSPCPDEHDEDMFHVKHEP